MSEPKRKRASILCAGIALTLWTSSITRAVPLPPELNLIPSEASMFVSIRVADLWSEARMKPLRDFVTKEPEFLNHFEKCNGFRPDNTERVTIFIPGFDPDRGPGEPCIVLTFKQPYDLDRMLDAWDVISPAEAQRLENAAPRRSGIAVEQNKVQKDQYSPKSIEEFPKPKFNEFPKPKFKDFPKPSEPEKGFQALPKSLEKLQEPAAEPKQLRKEDFQVRFEFADPDVKVKDPTRIQKANYYVLNGRGYLVPINDRTLVLITKQNGGFGAVDSIPDLLAVLLRRSTDGPLASALQLAAGNKHLVVAGCNLSSIKDSLRQDSWAEILPLNAILSSRSATMTLDLADELKLALHIESADAATAKRVHDVLKALHVLAMEMLPGVMKKAEATEPSFKMVLALLAPMVKTAEFEQKETTASVTMAAKADLAWAATLADAIEKTRQAADRVKMQNNLKQIGLAIHNYHDAMNHFPFPGISGPKGQGGALPNVTPNLSWRVAILPYIEQENLYRQFHFDEPWDSEHNKTLIPMMPKVYATNVRAEVGHTYLRTFNSPGTFGVARTFADITDGTSNTIMVVESSESVPWTKPDVFALDPQKPKAKLGINKGKLNVLMGDGSVRFIDLTKISDETLRNAITINDGMVLGPDW